MTLPTSGPLSLLDLKNEFGGTDPIRLSEYAQYVYKNPDQKISLSEFYGKTNPFFVNATISGSPRTLVLTSYLRSLGWNGTSPVRGNITIPSNVVIGAQSYGLVALDIDAIPIDSNLIITNYGTILGAGGAGGSSYNNQSSTASGSSAGSGQNGGTAVRASCHPGTVTLINRGTIAGGGGGGGAVTAFQWYDKWSYLYAMGGGGGAGIPGGAGGSASSRSKATYRYPGSPGSSTAGGAGGSSAGNGGGRGLPGQAGSNMSGVFWIIRGAGGSAGHYLVGRSRLIFENHGTLLGQVTN